jgi:hypothetical protein
MPGVTKDQALQIAQNIRGFAKTIEDYRIAHMSDLSGAQEADLRSAELSLRKASDAVTDAGINLALDDAQESLTRLGKVTELLKADVSKLADVGKAIQIVTALVQIGTAFSTGNLGGVASAIGTAVAALTPPAKAGARTVAAAPGSQSGGGAAGEP